MGYVSGQAEDGHEPAIVLINPRTHWRGDPSRNRFSPPQLRGLAPAGRLDIDSVGLLVLTQDGRIARQLIGEDSGMEKEYLVRVAYGPVATNAQAAFPRASLERLRHGLSLDGQPLKPARVDWQNPEQLRFVLTEGKKRQIRRMCELVGLKVVGLKRIRIGGVLLGQLPAGQWRYLGPHEKFRNSRRMRAASRARGLTQTHICINMQACAPAWMFQTLCFGTSRHALRWKGSACAIWCWT
jgi:23S rRNA pseudouridine2604 synthase